MNNNRNLETIWKRFISQYNLGTNHIPLFETDNNLNVETIIYGKNKKTILKLSEKINNVFKEISVLVRENDQIYDGILYIMYCIRSEKNLEVSFNRLFALFIKYSSNTQNPNPNNTTKSANIMIIL